MKSLPSQHKHASLCNLCRWVSIHWRVFYKFVHHDYINYTCRDRDTSVWYPSFAVWFHFSGVTTSKRPVRHSATASKRDHRFISGKLYVRIFASPPKPHEYIRYTSLRLLIMKLSIDPDYAHYLQRCLFSQTTHHYNHKYHQHLSLITNGLHNEHVLHAWPPLDPAGPIREFRDSWSSHRIVYVHMG
jgi:hypothetical protein